MMSARLKTVIVVLALAPALTSCRLFRKPPRPFTPPPAQARPAPAEKQPNPELMPPPELTPVESPQPAVVSQPQSQLPPPPSQKRPSPVGPRVPAQTQPPAAAPQLRPMLTEAQRQELTRVTGERIGRAQRVLKSLEGRRLGRDQADMASQIQTFIDQAEEARHTDLLRASNLAERAEVLANDLARRTR
jgi:hypothetical protein